MKLIPVIDCMNGIVVHARGGRRADYAPLQSPLCDDSKPVAIVDALLQLYCFDTLYVADLDAIESRGDNHAVLKQLLQAFPALKLWLDAGPVSATGRTLAPDRIRPVFGSECFNQAQLQAALADHPDGILSLDFAGHGLLGDAGVLETATAWPQDIIIMELQRVGLGLGPNWQRLEDFCRTHPQHRFHAAGGVRSDSDLHHLEKTGASGVLLASALHTRTISAGDRGLSAED